MSNCWASKRKNMINKGKTCLWEGCNYTPSAKGYCRNHLYYYYKEKKKNETMSIA